MPIFCASTPPNFAIKATFAHPTAPLHPPDTVALGNAIRRTSLRSLGGSRLAPQGASPAGLARGLRCFAPQGCRLSLAGPLHLPPFGVKWPPPRQSSPQKKQRPTNLPSAKKSIIQSRNILPHCDSKCPLPTRRAAFHHRDIRRFQPMFR